MKVIEAPSLAPAKGGLLSVVSLTETDGAGGLLYNGLTYETYLCGKNRVVPAEGGALAAPVLSGGAASAGGTFAAGTYYWKVTAVTGYGETSGSNEISAVLTLNQQKVLNWAAVAGAERYKLYRGTAAGAQDVLVGTVGAGTLTYTDTGTAGTAATVPATSTAGNIPAANKVFDKQTVIEASPFSLYRGVEDDILVGDNSAGEAIRAFKANESYGVEAKLQELVLNPVAEDLTPTPGTPVTNLRYAVGLLEQYAADHYSGLPLIHGNKVATTLILPELVAEGGVLQTVHGTPVAAGGGYGAAGPDSVTAGTGEAWLYITGQVNVWRGPIGEYAARDLKGNRAYALAEATYVATVECFVAAILVGI